MEVRGGGGVGFGGWGRQGVGFLSLRDPGSRCPDHPRWTGGELRGGFTLGGNLTISATGGRPKGKPKNEQRRPGKPNRLRRCSLLPATGRRDCNRNRESHVDREGKANYFFFLAAAFFAAGFFAAAFFAAAFLATVGSSS